MRLKKGAPGKGGESRPLSFSYTSVPNGLKAAFAAHVAGETYWCEEAHEHTLHDPGTKPCLNWITDGALLCPRCRRLRKKTCIGWVPLYREQDGKPVIVIVHESAADLLRDLRYPQSVLVGRVDDVSSVFVRKSDNPVSFRSDHPCKQKPADITTDLLTMWGMPELNDWLRRGAVPGAVKCEKLPDANSWRLSVPPPTTETEAMAVDAHRKAGPAGDGAVDDALKETLKRVKKAERNGQHKSEEDD